MSIPRVFLGMSGGVPVFRISKPGRSVFSSNPNDFILREDTEVLRPAFRGSVSVANNATASIDISSAGFIKPPFVHAWTSGIPHYWGYEAFFLTDWNTLRIRNQTGATRTIHYFVFGTTLEYSP